VRLTGNSAFQKAVIDLAVKQGIKIEPTSVLSKKHYKERLQDQTVAKGSLTQSQQQQKQQQQKGAPEKVKEVKGVEKGKGLSLAL
jgi:hypothetical protein